MDNYVRVLLSPLDPNVRRALYASYWIPMNHTLGRFVHSVCKSLYTHDQVYVVYHYRIFSSHDSITFHDLFSFATDSCYNEITLKYFQKKSKELIII
jgi:hypothetical protein